VLASATALAVLLLDYQAFLDAPVTVAEEGRALTVEPGASIKGIARRLEQAGVVRSALYLQIHARLEGLATRLKVGEYRIEPGTTPRTLLDQIVAGQVVQHSLTVVEGWTFKQLRAAMQAHPRLRQTLAGLDDAAVMARLGYAGQHPEGRFLPETYYFPAGTSDVDFLQRAYRALQRRLQAAWAERAPDLPLQTPYEALILASIIEKETGLPEERREIAGVFTRRLRKGMRLQTDPTVIYGLGESFDGNLRRADLRRDTPYNTYTRAGLPPTPIALPGPAAIAAAVDPAPGDTLYFVATGDGGHVFSRTLREHNRAVRKYQLRR